MLSHLTTGIHTLNIGGVPLTLQDDFAFTHTQLCGDVYFIFSIDSKSDIEEYNENNNIAAFSISTACIGGTMA